MLLGSRSVLLSIGRQLFCTAAVEAENYGPKECTINKPKVTVPELSKASCYYKLIESFYVPSAYCSIRYMLLPNLKVIDRV
ncbi:hypothetical protein BAE44_0010117 [Dichanthelium oligosanthes]|uniref:Uncharacterized protein n=1 Tax=Dichanthelium oligosanthes TaxID=888268 RepID=A0A1E5VUS6_9POAL|nr:hypothetical protein BAE44_0010117 [Dichanthelium oligosanthes]